MKTIHRSIVACLCLAACTRGGPADDIDIAALKNAAQRGDLEAQHGLCYRMSYGVNTAKNLPAALQWCEVAAQHGVPGSQTLLAEIYYHGEGVPIDYKKAAELYEAAARQGHVHAQYMLGLMHHHGRGVAYDEGQAAEWLRRSAAQGYEPAKNLLKEVESNQSDANR